MGGETWLLTTTRAVRIRGPEPTRGHRLLARISGSQPDGAGSIPAGPTIRARNRRRLQTGKPESEWKMEFRVLPCAPLEFDSTALNQPRSCFCSLGVIFSENRY